MTQQLITWWLVSSALGLAGLPLTTYLFRALPDRGYPFARSLGLLLTIYGAWLLAMLGLAPFDAGLLMICAAAIFGLGWLAKRTRSSSNSQLPALGSRFFPGWRLALAYELIFLVALVFMAMLRSRNPDPWGTERPMDFALFNAIQQSGSFPPQDPWLAGFSINYYYGGYMLMAAMNLLAGLDPAVAFNLSLALVFALTALGVAGVVVNLIRLSQEPGTSSQKSGGNRAGSWLLAPSFSVLLAITFVLLAGNQGGTLQVITGLPQVLELSGRDMVRAVQNGVGARTPLMLEDPFQEWGPNPPVEYVTPTDTWVNFNWWNPSRALYDSAPNPDDPTSYYAITEFPMFSFFLGDMHPHVMALPFGLLAMAVALATLARPSAPVFLQTWRGGLELVLTGIVLGSLYVINSWDFPTYLLLYFAAMTVLFIRLARPASPLPHRVLWQPLLQNLLLTALAAFATWLPFHLTIKSLVGSKDPLVDLPLLGALTRIIGVVNWDKTPLHTFLIIFGLFLLPLVGFVVAQGQAVYSAQNAQAALSGGSPAVRPSAASAVNRLGFMAQPAPALLPTLPWLVLGALVLGLVAGFPLLFLLPLAVYAALLATHEQRPGPAFALLATALGALVCFGTEVVYIRDNFEGGATRMNTIFKFYYQVWLIWGVMAGYALWRLVAGGWGDIRRPFSAIRRVIAVTAVALSALLLVGALIYPYQTAFKTLREQAALGLAGKTPRERTPGGAASIAWLRANTRGNAVILEAVGNSYDSNGGAGVAASTGRSTLLGWWSSHELLWRGGDAAARAEIEPRRLDIDLIYSTPDFGQARDLLVKYGVDYVYIGEYERNLYDAASLDKFAQFGQPVFAQDEVVIYRLER